MLCTVITKAVITTYTHILVVHQCVWYFCMRDIAHP